MYQLRNLIGRSNVTADPVHRFNECDDFFKLIVTCHVLAAAMKELGMTSLDDVPTISSFEESHNLWMETSEQRKAVLQSICEGIVDNFVQFKFNNSRKSSNDMVSSITSYLKFHILFSSLSCIVKL